MDARSLADQLQRAWRLEQDGQALQAERVYMSVLEHAPEQAVAAAAVGRLAVQRGDLPKAVSFLGVAFRGDRDNDSLGVDLALALATAGRAAEARSVLDEVVARKADSPVAWLLLGRLREAGGDRVGALLAWHQATTRARRAGQWRDESTTPANLLGLVLHAIERLRDGRRELFFGCYEQVRQEHGSAALTRMDRALQGYLGDWDATPADPRQRPIFFYFPDLPSEPYVDPGLQPWARRLEEAFADVRSDALRVLDEDRKFQSFLDLPPGAHAGNYVGGEGAAPAWDAFFFYRHGKRFDQHHERCPDTSALLESIDLCRIADQAPEICFSVLAPGTHLMPHYGVTNVRLVMHLPLVVPADCALNVLGAGEHHWQEGRPMMFDDTFRHEAWNRSSSERIILLMDCWNPRLTEVERLALSRLIETISGLRTADEGVDTMS